MTRTDNLSDHPNAVKARAYRSRLKLRSQQQKEELLAKKRAGAAKRKRKQRLKNKIVERMEEAGFGTPFVVGEKVEEKTLHDLEEIIQGTPAGQSFTVDDVENMGATLDIHCTEQYMEKKKKHEQVYENGLVDLGKTNAGMTDAILAYRTANDNISKGMENALKFKAEDEKLYERIRTGYHIKTASAKKRAAGAKLSCIASPTAGLVKNLGANDFKSPPVVGKRVAKTSLKVDPNLTEEKTTNGREAKAFLDATRQVEFKMSPKSKTAKRKMLNLLEKAKTMLLNPKKQPMQYTTKDLAKELYNNIDEFDESDLENWKSSTVAVKYSTKHIAELSKEGIMMLPTVNYELNGELLRTGEFDMSLIDKIEFLDGKDDLKKSILDVIEELVLVQFMSSDVGLFKKARDLAKGKLDSLEKDDLCHCLAKYGLLPKNTTSNEIRMKTASASKHKTGNPKVDFALGQSILAHGNAKIPKKPKGPITVDSYVKITRGNSKGKAATVVRQGSDGKFFVQVDGTGEMKELAVGSLSLVED